jgi:DNA (cytosine-5)-methyltransferase 1
MPEHQCNNCMRIFKQKGHLQSHLKRKNPCVKSTTIEEIIEKKVAAAISKTNVNHVINLNTMNIQFIDLFCGIGGFHQAIQRVIPSSTCVLASDIDPLVQETYKSNYNIQPVGDIKEIDISSIKPFSLLCGGFPCQAFSAAGKKNGFDDPRGTLFFDILRIVDHHKPNTILLENVANLTIINGGVIMKRIVKELEDRDYKVSYGILTPHQFGVPQSRDRVYIVASLKTKFDFTSLLKRTSECCLRSILDSDVDTYINPSKYTLIDNSQVKTQKKSGLRFCGYLNGTLRKKGAKENTEHLSRVHKQTARIHSADGNQPTLAASETSGRYHIYDGTGVRKLTLNECYKLMDYPDTFKKHKKTGTAYKQIGNSVCVRVVEEVFREIIKQRIL